MAITSRQRFFPTCYGKEFTDRLFGLRKRAPTGEHEFDKLCADLDIDHRLTPPKSPQTNGMVERFNGRIEEVLQSHHFRSGEELEATLHRYVWLYNQQLPQSALDSRSPLQAMKDWHKLKPELFKKRPYYLPGCDRIDVSVDRGAVTFELCGDLRDYPFCIQKRFDLSALTEIKSFAQKLMVWMPPPEGITMCQVSS